MMTKHAAFGVQALLLLVNLYALLPSHQVLSDFVGYRVHSGTKHRVVGVRFACVGTSRTTVQTSAEHNCQHMRFALIIRALPVPGRCVPMYLFVPPLRYNDPDVHGA